MNKIFTILIISLLTGPSMLFAQENAKELAKAQKDRERLIDLVITLQKDFGGTLNDYAQLQEDYATLLKKNEAPDYSSETAELRKKLDEALARLKEQKAAPTSGSSHALLEQDLVNLRNELHRQRQELLVARARVLRVKQLETQNQALQDQIKEDAANHLKTSGQLKAIRAERDDLMKQLNQSMAAFKKTDQAHKDLLVRLEQLEKENLALKKTISDQKNRITELSRIEKDHQKAVAAAAALEKENAHLTKLLAEQEKKLANLQQHLATEVKRTLEIPVLIQARDELQKKLNEHDAKTKALGQENEVLTARKTELEAEIAKVETDITEMRGQLAQNKAAMVSVTKLTKENETLKTEQSALETTLEMAKAELVKSMGTRKRLEAQLAESKNLAVANAELKQKNAALMEEQDLLHDQLVNTKATLETTRKLTDELQASMLELAKEKADLSNEITENEAEIARLRADVAREPAIEDNLEKLEKEKDELAAKLAKREEDLKSTRSELGRLQIAATVAEKELVSLKREEAKIDPVRYALGETEITQQQTRVLKQVREVLEHFPQARFEIIGHTCDLGKADANLKLSQQRARALHDFLTSKGIPGDRLKSRGVGQTEPMVSNTSEENRRLNRRVVVEILD